MNDNSARILLADDDTLFCKLTARLLETRGYLVEQVHDAFAALDCVSITTFDLIIADVNMPGNEGLPLLWAQSVVPVLIVTGEPSLESAVAALRGAAVDYLAKPFSPEQFLARVTDGVARGRSLRTLANAEQLLRGHLDLVANLRTSLQISGPTPSIGEVEPPSSMDLDELLSAREREVLQTFRATPHADLVAERLFISPHTVRNHMKSIFRKLRVNSQVELLARLAQTGRQETKV
jgi:DNA-binding NarL/FixJ family response regulator